MAHPTAVILVAGLSPSLIGKASPRIAKMSRQGRLRRLKPVLPAVTCSVQSTMLTGLAPSQHGIVGNGWYDRPSAEICFWKQSNHLVAGEKVWETARRRDPSVTCLKMFWWYNMYSSADYSVTPRPIYKADGRKIPDCYSHPPHLRDQLQERFGPFPLFSFWGPGCSIRSSQWIADATIHLHEQLHPTLTLVYLPHLDYGLQKLGPEHRRISKQVSEIDRVVGGLLDYFDAQDVRSLILSEYGIEPVDEAVHINRFLREEGAVAVRSEEGMELLDAGASDAFAVADHQVAHLYVKDPNKVRHYADLCGKIPGVAEVLDHDTRASLGLVHPRAGDLLLVAEERRWFSYYHWLDDTKAPDFARTVDIHRKPGYDPCELFLDPTFCCPKLRIAWKLFKKNVLGMRTLLDMIPLDAALVRGSHGRVEQSPEVQPVMITGSQFAQGPEQLPCAVVRDIILQHLFD